MARIWLPPVVQAAKCMSAPTRLRILTYLMKEESAVSDLAVRLGLEHSRLCHHLRVLRQCECLSVRVTGRLHLYSVDRDRVEAVMKALDRWPRFPKRKGVPTERWWGITPKLPDLRQARACYDHLGGAAGVYLLDQLLRRGWVIRQRESRRTMIELSTRGAQALVRRRANVFWARQSRRLFAFECRDWSDRQHHLGGALGAAVFESLMGTRVLQPDGRSRQIVLLRPLASWFDRGTQPAVGSRVRPLR